jgi:hypothetical protein
MPTVASNEAVASAAPVGAHATARTVFECPVSIVPADLKLHRDDGEAGSGAGLEEGISTEESSVLIVPGREYDHSRTVLSAEQEARRG